MSEGVKERREGRKGRKGWDGGGMEERKEKEGKEGGMKGGSVGERRRSTYPHTRRVTSNTRRKSNIGSR